MTEKFENSDSFETSSFSRSSDEFGDIVPLEMSTFSYNTQNLVDVQPYNVNRTDSITALSNFTAQHENNIDLGYSAPFLKGRGRGFGRCLKKTLPSDVARKGRSLMSETHDEVIGMTSWSCAVCGDAARGRYFGVMVCLPCKSFYIRCTQRNQSNFRVQCDGNCNVISSDRPMCPRCRFQKCLSVGMCRKERPEVIIPTEKEALCVVCGDIANGVHFGVLSCEGCKKFFSRGLAEYSSYACKFSGICAINPRIRASCRYCRFQKCLQVGMSRGRRSKHKKRMKPKCGPPKTDTTRHPDQTDGLQEVTTQQEKQKVPEQCGATATLEQKTNVSETGDVNELSNNLQDKFCTEGLNDWFDIDWSSISSDSVTAGQVSVEDTDGISDICLSSDDGPTSAYSLVSSTQRECIGVEATDANKDVVQNELTEAEHARSFLEELCKVTNNLTQESYVPSSSSETTVADQNSTLPMSAAAVTTASSKTGASSAVRNSESKFSFSESEQLCRTSEKLPSLYSSQTSVQDLSQAHDLGDNRSKIMKENENKIMSRSLPTSTSLQITCSHGVFADIQRSQESLSNSEMLDKNQLLVSRKQPESVSCWPLVKVHRMLPSRQRKMTNQVNQCTNMVNPLLKTSYDNTASACSTAASMCSRSYCHCNMNERNHTVTMHCNNSCCTCPRNTQFSHNYSCFHPSLTCCAQRCGISKHTRPYIARNRALPGGNCVSTEVPERRSAYHRFVDVERTTDPFVRVKNKQQKLSADHYVSCNSSDWSEEVRTDSTYPLSPQKHHRCAVLAGKAQPGAGHTPRESSTGHVQQTSSTIHPSSRESSDQTELDNSISGTLSSPPDGNFPKKSSSECSATAVCLFCSQTIRVCTDCHPCPLLTHEDHPSQIS